MGDMVDFASNGDTARGYLATPDGGSGPGVIVVQEWWGLDPNIKQVADQLAADGFAALAPDLYRGELAGHDEMDKAGQLMASLPMDRAARDMSGAIDFLAEHAASAGDGIGVIGFCMGGGLALMLGTMRPDKVKAVVPYYGVLGFDDDHAPDWSKLDAPVLGHYGEKDDFFPAERARTLETGLKGLGKSAQLVIYADRGHAFASAHDALGTYHEEDAKRAWQHTVSFLHEHLG